MKKPIAFLIAYYAFLQINFACSCLTPDSFCESITSSNGELNASAILRGKVLDTGPSGKEVKVDQVIYGNINQSKITIGYGFCDINYQGLEDGKEFIIALGQSNTGFQLVGCAISFLEIDNEVVLGKIAPGLRSVDYDELSSVMECGDAFSLLNLSSHLSLFPNPTDGELNIKNINTNIGLQNLEVHIFDITGRLISTYKRDEELLQSEIWELNIKDFPVGVYIVRVSINSFSSSYKVVKHFS